MIWTDNDQQRIDEKLRTLLNSGLPINDALPRLHVEQAVGVLFLVSSVQTITGVSKEEAMQLVVSATFS